MAAYRIEVGSGARRDLGRLAPAVLERVARALTVLGDEPRPTGSEKLIGLEAYRIRIGDYRAIYEVDDHARLVIVSRVRHRREVYRKLR